MNSKVLDKNKIMPYVIGGIVSIIASLLLIILFALLIKWFSLPNSIITPVNLVIKAVSIFIGLNFVLKDKTKGLIKGAIFGSVYCAFAFIVFSILAGTFSIGISFLLDLLYTVSVGGVIGIILVNIKK